MKKMINQICIAIIALMSFSPLVYADISPDSILQIVDLELNQSTFDPWDNEEIDFTFIINKEAYITLEIYDEDNDLITKVKNKVMYSKGQHTVFWMGKDSSGDIVNQGDYKYKLVAEIDDERDTEKGTIEVKKGSGDFNATEDPRLKYVFVTKDNFDPGIESTYIVFYLTAKANIQVDIFDPSGIKIDSLFNKSAQLPGVYKLEWDGEDALNEPGTYGYRINVSNSKGTDMKNGAIQVADDTKESNKPNVTKDRVDINDMPYVPKNNSLDISFRLDKSADMTMEIREDDYVVAEVFKDKEMGSGAYTLSWNGKDSSGDYVSDGVYSYKLIASNDSGKDTEKGYFLIQGSSSAEFGEKCGNFPDVEKTYTYCEAIEWAKGEGIFKGYDNGTFQPNKALNRVEALKTILEALEINSVSVGSSLPFPDTFVSEWYAPYLKAALSLGIVEGYKDGKFRPGKEVARSEALKILLVAAQVKYHLVIPSSTYGNPYSDTPSNEWYIKYVWLSKEHELTDNNTLFFPNQPMTRAQFADMLYRFHKAGLDTEQ